MLKQTWLEMVVGAWLCLRNVPPDSILLSFIERPVESWPQGILGGGHVGNGPGPEGVALELDVSQTHQADLSIESADAAHAHLRKHSILFKQQTVNGQ